MRLVRSDTALLDDLSLECDALSFRSAPADARFMGTMELIRVAIACATVHFAEIAFSNLRDAVADLAVLEPFAVLTAV